MIGELHHLQQEPPLERIRRPWLHHRGGARVRLMGGSLRLRLRLCLSLCLSLSLSLGLLCLSLGLGLLLGRRDGLRALHHLHLLLSA